ncbi:MAG: 4-(cytidine 5'-diphospho)-2-C-methyl-D-erythritol kinase [Anaerovoracaceae bacterium]
MKAKTIKSHPKINLSIDVLRRLPNGYHEVALIMQQLEIYDEVTIRLKDNQNNLKELTREDGSYSQKISKDTNAIPRGNSFAGNVLHLEIKCNDENVPLDKNNIVYKAAELIFEEIDRSFTTNKKDIDSACLKSETSKITEISKPFPIELHNLLESYSLEIDIDKRVPVAAGLGGGSANGAAVLLGLNELLSLNLSLETLYKMGEKLGADVPFAIMGMVGVASCALAEGIGERLTAIMPLKSYVVLCKPNIGISTAEVYQGLDMENITHCDTEGIISALNSGNFKGLTEKMSNALEAYTLNRYPIVGKCKEDFIKAIKHANTVSSNCAYRKDPLFQDLCDNQNSISMNEFPVMMSGSGPTIFGLFQNKKEAQEVYELLLEKYSNTFLTQTK